MGHGGLLMDTPMLTVLSNSAHIGFRLCLVGKDLFEGTIAAQEIHRNGDVGWKDHSLQSTL